MNRCIGVLASAMVIVTGCSGHAKNQVLSMVVQAGPLDIAVHAEGEAQAASSTPLVVPGQRFMPRQLAWVLPDGSRVKKGEVVARFSADKSKQVLAKAMIDLARNGLVREGKLSSLAGTRGQLRVNLAQVASQLVISNRYAEATVAAVARDKILDAIENVHYLRTRQHVLQWRQSQSGKRGKAELAVVGARQATLKLNANQARDNLDALTLRAPHDGILMLQADWTGQTPQVGSSLYGGRAFANLPDLTHLEVILQVPQIEAQGIVVGLRTTLYPLGNPEQKVGSEVSWVARTATPISSRNPVKYLAMKVPLPAAAVKEYGWLPGMRFAARIVLINAKSTLSVPNLTLNTSGDGVRVQVLQGGKLINRSVTLGVRGAARSQITAGLKSGDRVLLAPATSESRL